MSYVLRVGNNRSVDIAGWNMCEHASEAYSYHMSTSFFSEPGESWPERWLDDSRLDHHLLAFSRETRGCNGHFGPYISWVGGLSANLPHQAEKGWLFKKYIYSQLA